MICPRCREQYPEGIEICPACQTDLCEPEDLQRVGLSFHNYEILDVIGVGGMGVVYKARHVTLLKPVAIKIFNERYGRRKDATHEMLREAQAASRIRHPHIVDITDFGNTSDGAPYFVMEYLEGESLNMALARQQLFPLNRALRIARQAASALAAAHKAGIVHRDLKPENIYLLTIEGLPREAAEADGGTDFIKILDFGLAKVFDMGPSSRTRAGMLAGTPWYMSPEQAKNSPVDGRSDIYALGVVLYQMVTGSVPFDGPSAVDILLAHVTSPAVQPYRHRPGIDENTNSVIMQCLEKDPDKRFQSMEELGEAIEHCGDRLHLQSGEILPELAAHELPESQVESRPTMSAEFTSNVISSAPLSSPDSTELKRAAALIRLGINPTVSAELSAPGLSSPPSHGGETAAAPAAAPPKERRGEYRWVLAAVVASLLVALGYAGWTMKWFARPHRAAALQQTVRITLAGLPAGALVYLDGVLVAARPLVVARSRAQRHLVVEAPGFMREERHFSATGDRQLFFRMTAVATPSSQAAVASAPVAVSESRAHKRKPQRRQRRLTRRSGPDILRGSPEVVRQTAQENRGADKVKPAPDEGQGASKAQSEPKVSEKTAAKPPAKQKAPAKKGQLKFKDWIRDPLEE